MANCHCGSGKSLDACCGPILDGTAKAETAEALMRSRYSAYVVANADYLGESLHPEHRDDWDRDATLTWAKNSEWLNLEIRSTEAGGANDEFGIVEFLAQFKEGDATHTHHEISRFQQVDGTWYYLDGEAPKPETVRRDTPKVGRNDPCICGSGKKYKKCCGK